MLFARSFQLEDTNSCTKSGVKQGELVQITFYKKVNMSGLLWYSQWLCSGIVIGFDNNVKFCFEHLSIMVSMKAFCIVHGFIEKIQPLSGFHQSCKCNKPSKVKGEARCVLWDAFIRLTSSPRWWQNEWQFLYSSVLA